MSDHDKLTGAQLDEDDPVFLMPAGPLREGVLIPIERYEAEIAELRELRKLRDEGSEPG